MLVSNSIVEIIWVVDDMFSPTDGSKDNIMTLKLGGDVRTFVLEIFVNILAVFINWQIE